MRHETLRAVEHPAISVATRTRRRRERIGAARVVERSREQGLAARDARQPARLLRRAAELRERKRAEHERRERRVGHHGAAELFEQRAQLEKAHPHAAVRLGNRDPEQIRFGELRPERGIEPVGRALCGAQPLLRRLALEDLAGEGANRLLLFAGFEVHLVTAPP